MFSKMIQSGFRVYESIASERGDHELERLAPDAGQLGQGRPLAGLLRACDLLPKQ